jgi:hypothetical protein
MCRRWSSASMRSKTIEQESADQVGHVDGVGLLREAAFGGGGAMEEAAASWGSSNPAAGIVICWAWPIWTRAMREHGARRKATTYCPRWSTTEHGFFFR